VEEDEKVAREIVTEFVPKGMEPFIAFCDECVGEAGRNVFDSFGVNNYIDFYGLSVRKDFR
jgi:hypothetical protein